MKIFLLTLLISSIVLVATVKAVDTHLINDCQDLQNIQHNLNDSFILTQDIDCAGFNFASIGNGGWFTGMIDGQGYNISNLTINEPTESFVGLFEWIGATGVVKNIIFENVNINGGDSAGGVVSGLSQGVIEGVHIESGNVRSSSRAGGLTGLLFGRISQSSSYIDVGGALPNNGVFAGGLVGECGVCVVENSFATGNVKAMNPIYGQVGGLVGRNIAGTIRNTYATGNVTGAAVGAPHSGAGGLVGFSVMGNSVINSYATGQVAASIKPGRLIGDLVVFAPINSYWFDHLGDSAMFCLGASWVGACPLISSKNIFYDETHDVYDTIAPHWNFVDIWQSNDPIGFPTLRRKAKPVDFNL